MCYVLSTCKRLISPLLYNKFDLIWFDTSRYLTWRLPTSTWETQCLQGNSSLPVTLVTYQHHHRHHHTRIYQCLNCRGVRGFNPLVIFSTLPVICPTHTPGGSGQTPNSPCSLHIVVMLNPFSVNPEYSSHSFRNLAQLTQIPVLVWAYEHTRRHFCLDITHLHCVCDDNYSLIYINTHKLCIS